MCFVTLHLYIKVTVWRKLYHKRYEQTTAALYLPTKLCHKSFSSRQCVSSPRPYTIAISHTTSNVLKQNITSAIINSRAHSSVPLEHNHEQTNSKIAV